MAPHQQRNKTMLNTMMSFKDLLYRLQQHELNEYCILKQYVAGTKARS